MEVNARYEEKDDPYNLDQQTKNAKGKLGINPVKRRDIVYEYRGENDPNEASDFEVFYGKEFFHARCEASLKFLEVELLFSRSDIKIVNAVMSRNGYASIMWLELTEADVKMIFQRAAKVRGNKKFQLLTYFPPHLYDKKRNLDRLLKLQRNIEPTLRTQIRLGDHDLELFTKHKDEKYWRQTLLTAYGDPANPPVIPAKPARGGALHHSVSANKRKLSSPTKDDRDQKKGKTDDNEINGFKMDEDEFLSSSDIYNLDKVNK